MKDSKKAIEETRTIKGLAADAHHLTMNYDGMLEPRTKEHAKQQAITYLKAIEEHVRAALAALE